MSEVFICRGGSGSGSGKPYPGAEKVLQSYLITESQDWVVPNNIINNELSIVVVGGGGGVDRNNVYSIPGVGGGGGWMNNGTVKVGSGSVIPIIVGKAGNNTSGGETSFGTYLSASGGGAAFNMGRNMHGGSGGSGGYGDRGGVGYQFGGAGSGGGYIGGNGGVWGGGGGGGCSGGGGSGGYYGGGGGGGGRNYSQDTPEGGDGGYYGGGGGGYWNAGKGGWYNDNGTWKQSGLGGNGGCFRNNLTPENGTNTIGWTNVSINTINNNYITGSGIAGRTPKASHDQSNNNCLGGGGGFGGNGGMGIYWERRTPWCSGGGGGGGYGCRGGSADGNNYYSYYGGGGGGYGGTGGHADGVYRYKANGEYIDMNYASGGGGGYMCNGCYGGGGYYCNSIAFEGGGVKLLNNVLGRGMSYEWDEHGNDINVNSTDGGCLIQFYQWL